MEANKDNPEVSVIIPVYNDPYGLRDTLRSLVFQDFPNDEFEIIVADNGSTDNTKEIAEEFIIKYPDLIRTVTEDKKRGSYAARNKGIKASKGSITAFIDADMTVDKDWLSNVLDSLEEHQADCLTCRVEVYLKEETLFEKYNKMVAFPIEEYVLKKHYIPSGCSTIRKEVFSEVRLFDSRLISGGDREFGNRVYRTKYKMYYDSNIVMKHPARTSLRGILSKAFRIGRGSRQTYYYYPKRYKRRSRNIKNLLYFLPRKTTLRLAITMKGNKIWDEASFAEKLGFYLIDWATSVASHIGYIYEVFRKKGEANK